MYQLSFFHLFVLLQGPSWFLTQQSLGTTIAIVSGLVTILVGVTALWRGQKKIIVKQTLQEQGQKHLVKTVNDHGCELQKIKQSMMSPETIEGNASVIHRLNDHDKEIARLERMHISCAERQSAKTTAIFTEMKEIRVENRQAIEHLRNIIEAGFSTVNNDIKDILKQTK